VSIEEESKLVKALKADNLIFDFTVNYVNQNKDLTLENFELNNNLMEDFKKFIDQKEFSFESETDKKIEELKSVATSEDYLKPIQSSINELQKQLNKEKQKAFQTEAKTIQKLINEGILRKLGYDEAVYTYYTNEGEVIEEAIKTLNDTKAYNTTLGRL
jgi:carboxyl-terminal processing protease